MPAERAGAAPRTNVTLAILLRLGAVLCFAAMGACVKLAYDAGVSAPETLFYRFVFGFPPLLAWIAWSGSFGAWRTHRPLAHIARSALGLTTMGLNFLALFYLPLAEATTIGFATPFFAVMLSALLLGEKVGPHRWSAVAVGFLGVLIVARPDAGHLSATGATFAIVGAFGAGAVITTLRSIGRTETTQTTVLLFSLAGLLVFGCGFMPVYGQVHAAATWPILVLIGLTGGIAQILFTAALRYAPVSVVVPFDYSQLVWAVLLGGLIWASWPAGSTWVGAGLIVAGGLYTSYRERRLGRVSAPASPDAGAAATSEAGRAR